MPYVTVTVKSALCLIVVVVAAAISPICKVNPSYSLPQVGVDWYQCDQKKSPNVYKRCPKSNKSLNLVTLIGTL